MPECNHGCHPYHVDETIQQQSGIDKLKSDVEKTIDVCRAKLFGNENRVWYSEAKATMDGGFGGYHVPR
jgi:hypothetical protein